MDDTELMEEQKMLGKPINELPQPIPITSKIIAPPYWGSFLAVWTFANTFGYGTKAPDVAIL